MIVTTCLTLVVFTTVFFGATVGLVQKCLFAKDIANVEIQSVDTEQSVHSDALHPNEEKEEDDGAARKYGCFLTTWMRLDELILRPLLIHNYKRDRRMMEKDFFELYEMEGNEVAKIFNDANKDQGEDKSASSAQFANAVQALKRKRSMRPAEMLQDAKMSINHLDDNFEQA